METRPPQLQSAPPAAPAYEWSNERVKEQVTINVLSNVLSAACIGLGAAILAVLGLLAQWLFHYVVVPTNVLTAIAFIGVGILLMLLAIAVWAAVLIHQNPMLIFGALLGAVVGMAIVTSLQSGSWKEALKKAAASNGAGSSPPSPPTSSQPGPTA